MNQHRGSRFSRRPPPPEGLPARNAAIRALRTALEKRVALEVSLAGFVPGDGRTDDPRDLPFARSIATASLRRLGTLRAAIAARLDKGLPKASGPLEAILVTAAAQILLLDVPDHAAVDCAVRIARQDGRSAHYDGLVNAVLRRIAADRATAFVTADPFLDLPDWLAARWRQAYGAETAAAMAVALRDEQAVDLTLKSTAPAEAERWAKTLDALPLPNGSLRLKARTEIAQLPGYREGAWWVQNAAAALPARLLGDVAGRRVLDLCAAPGGKTAQLAAAGAHVVAVDRSAPRMERLAANLRRLGLSAEIRVGDALGIADGPHDAILLDAPCSATGTARRHPDVAWTKRPEDIGKLAELQARLLAHAAGLLAPGGRLVYATCSLEPEEGEAQVARFLAAHPGFARAPVMPSETGGDPALITAEGDLRTRPDHWANHPGSSEARLGGLDGFFAARLVRSS